MFKPHTSLAKLSRNTVCDQRRFTVLIAVHHVKLEQNSYLFQLAACLMPAIPAERFSLET